MTNKIDYIVSLLNKEFNSNQIMFIGIDITIILKKGLKINLSVLEKEVLINPKNALYFLFRKKSNNDLMTSAIGKIENIFLAEQIDYTVLQVLGSSSK